MWDMPTNIRVDLFMHSDKDTAERLLRMEKLLSANLQGEQVILKNQEKIMATLDDVLADVTSESTAIDSVTALITGLKQQVADALSGVTLPSATQAKIDAVFTGLESNKGKLTTALAANTPAAPVTPTPTTP